MSDSAPAATQAARRPCTPPPSSLFHGDRDENVGIGESRLMVDKIRGAGGKVELVEFSGLDHQLYDPAARARLLARADAFLRASMGMAP